MPARRDRGTRDIEGARPCADRDGCVFCDGRTGWVDYKDVNLLSRFMTDAGGIRARRVSGNCDRHQRDVAAAIKTARELALLPYEDHPEPGWLVMSQMQSQEA